MVELFIVQRTKIVQRRVSPALIVEGLDVEEQVRPCLVAGVIHTMMDQFTFQRAEEALHRRIVIPGADAIHAHLETMVLQQGLIGTVRVLTALIGVYYFRFPVILYCLFKHI